MDQLIRNRLLKVFDYIFRSLKALEFRLTADLQLKYFYFICGQGLNASSRLVFYDRIESPVSLWIPEIYVLIANDLIMTMKKQEVNVHLLCQSIFRPSIYKYHAK